MFYFSISSSMKKIISLVLLFCLFLLPSLGFAQESSSRWKYGSDPTMILDRVVEEANQDYKIQQTALDGATDLQWGYQSQYKIANTLDRFRNNINPYLQRAVYIWLSVAVILLIYTGLLMVTGSLHKEWDMAKLKSRMIYIVIWVVLLTGFYFIIKLAVSLINSIFGGYGWATWF